MVLTHGPIDAADFVRSSTDPSCGAEVIFLGVVRGASDSRRVLFLEYEAYEDMAESVLAQLVREARHRWPLHHVKLRHRLGRLRVGETAVVIWVSSAHRAPAYEASRFLIEGIKHRVPIWKREFFADGTSTWGGSCEVADVPSGSSQDRESHAPACAEVSAAR